MFHSIKPAIQAALFSCLAIFSLTACGAFDINPVDQAVVDSTATTDVDSLAVNVGDQAPGFNLKDGEGKSHSLRELTAESAVLLVFYRGDWCPFCIDHLDSINAVLGDLSEKGVQVVGVSPDKVATVQNTERRFGQDFIFVSDEGSQTIASYGIARDEKLPHPAQFLIGKDGVVKWLYAGTDYKTRPTGAQLLEAIDKHL